MAAWTRPVLAPTPVSMRRLALAGVIADTVIMSTGAAVRLSASGLGCPDWPQCSAADVVASKNAGQTLLNTWIEFGNRLLNFPLVIIAALIFIAAWRFRPDGPTPGYRRRRDLVWLGAAQPLGVVAQAVIGGIVVLTKLNPATVSVHFLVSAAVVAAAVALHMRCAAIADTSGMPETTPVRRDLRVISGGAGRGHLPDADGGHGRHRDRAAGRRRGRAPVPAAPGGGHPVSRGHRLAAGRPVHRPGARAAAVRGTAAGGPGPAGSCSRRWDRRASSATSSTSPTSRPGWSGST